MVHEFDANEKTWENIDVRAASISNRKFSKSDVTAEYNLAGRAYILETS